MKTFEQFDKSNKKRVMAVNVGDVIKYNIREEEYVIIIEINMEEDYQYKTLDVEFVEDDWTDIYTNSYNGFYTNYYDKCGNVIDFVKNHTGLYKKISKFIDTELDDYDEEYEEYEKPMNNLLMTLESDEELMAIIDGEELGLI